jgi:RNA polymerase-binding protein DksA
MAALNKDQTKRLTQALERRQKLLLEEVRSELERSGDQHYADLAGRVSDAGDQSVADLITDLGAAMVDRQVHELRDIDAARERLAAGNYGDCEDCGTEIGFERLMAYPTARRCIQCQNKHERGFAHTGTPRL